jgi:sRNA-binding regulator protein Hfq
MKESSKHISNLLENSGKNRKPLTIQLKTGGAVEGVVLFFDDALLVVRRVVQEGETKTYYNYYIFTDAVELMFECLPIPVLEFSPAQVQIELGGDDEE